MLELIAVVFYEKESKAEVTIRDRSGRLRRVTLSLHSKDGMAVPADWLSLVEAEIDYQDAAERNPLLGMGE